MSPRPLRLAGLLAFLAPLALIAQSSASYGSDEELVALSPFTISTDSDSGLVAQSYAGTRIATEVADPRSAAVRPSVPVTVIKRADALAVQFFLSNANEKAPLRNQELNATIVALQAALQRLPGVRVEQREVRFAAGNRKLVSFSRGAEQTSFATLVVFADLLPDLRLADRVKQVRDAIDSAKLAGQTKLNDGVVGLYLKQPGAYRREILQAIFDDLEFVKKGLGAEIELLPSGLNQKVNVRVCSETEVELWIDYSFTLQSVRALTAKH